MNKETSASYLRALVASATIWALGAFLGFAILGYLNGHSLGEPYFIFDCLFLLGVYLLGGALIIWCVFASIFSFKHRNTIPAILCILIICSIIVEAILLPCTYSTVYRWAEKDKFEGIGIVALRTEVFDLQAAHKIKAEDQIFIEASSLPPHLKKVVAYHAILSEKGLIVTTAGLGEHRSGFIITPIIANAPEATDLVEGIHVWSYPAP